LPIMPSPSPIPKRYAPHPPLVALSGCESSFSIAPYFRQMTDL